MLIITALIDALYHILVYIFFSVVWLNTCYIDKSVKMLLLLSQSSFWACIIISLRIIFVWSCVAQVGGGISGTCVQYS
jgi:hypothetical protein